MDFTIIQEQLKILKNINNKGLPHITLRSTCPAVPGGLLDFGG